MENERIEDPSEVENESNVMDEWLADITSKLPKDQADKLCKIIEDEMSVPPKLAVIGKSGVGKTETIKNLFDVEWHTSEVFTGTKDVQKETFQLKGGWKLTAIDMPGLGDSIAKDERVLEIYKEILPDVDVIFYIMQADDRGLGDDEKIIEEILKCGKDLDKKLVIGLNKVDLLGENEGLEWDDLSNLPSEEQESLIERKCADISKRFLKDIGIKKDAVTYFSANKRYNLYHVLYAIIIHSGNSGWKFSICPKDWKELANPRIRRLAEEKKKKG